MQKKFAHTIKIFFITAFIVGGFGLLGKYLINRSSTPSSSISISKEIISRRGIHWHAELSIFIKGQKQDIPANVGIGAVHQPLHTHDYDNVIHMEFPGLVRGEDIKLGNFFETWEKQFNKDCIFDKCSGPENRIKMLVNGKENSEFENYKMQDNDKIEIRYE